MEGVIVKLSNLIYQLELNDEETILNRFTDYERLMLKTYYPDDIERMLLHNPYRIIQDKIPRKDVLLNLRYIAVQSEVLTGKIDFIIRNALPNLDNRTLTLYKYYMIEYAKQNLVSLYDTIDRTIKELDNQQQSKEAKRKSIWYQRIRENKISNWSKNLIKQTPIKLARLERKIKTSIVITHFQLIKKIQVVQTWIIISHSFFSLATIKRCPSVSYEIIDRIERDSMNKTVEYNRIKPVNESKIRISSRIDTYDTKKASKLRLFADLDRN